MCPTLDTLRLYALGQLTSLEREHVEEHLRTCGACRVALETVPAGNIDPTRAGPGDVQAVPADASGSDSAGRADSSLPFSRPDLGLPNVGDDQPPQPAVGQEFGRYEILERVGKGGMGKVYKARDKVLGHVVALKLIKEEYWDDPEFRERFQREAELGARLKHPNVVRLLHFGEDHGRLYCVFEFIEGGTLSKRLANAPLAPHVAAEMVESLARGVQHAHDNKVIHRDLKPDNILLSATDPPILQIADFGLAKQLDRDDGKTRTGVPLGTAHYMSPEQAAGDVRRIDTPTDVWSLGVILYQMVVGEVPFRGDSVTAILERIQKTDPDPPSRRCLRRDRDFDAICLKCLEKEPAKRYCSARELAEDLWCYIRGWPIKARRPSWLERARKAVKRNKRASAFAALFAVVVIALLAFLTVVNGKLKLAISDKDRAISDKDRAYSELNRANLDLKKAVHERNVAIESQQRDLYASRLQNIGDKAFRDPVQAEKDLLDETPFPFNRRDFAHGYLLAITRRRKEYPVDPSVTGVDCLVAVAPDGETFATGHSNGCVCIWNKEGVLSRPEKAHQGRINRLTFSPDKTETVLTTAGEDARAILWSWDEKNCAVIKRREFAAGGSDGPPVNDVSFSRDGRFLATAHRDSRIRLWDVTKNGEPVSTLEPRQSDQPVLEPDPQSALAVAFCPHDAGLVVSGHKDATRVWRASGDGKWTEESVLKNEGGAWAITVAFSPQKEPQVFAAGNSAGVVQICCRHKDDTRKWQPTPVSFGDGKDKKIRCVAFSADGSQIAVACSDGTARVRSCPVSSGSKDVFVARHEKSKNSLPAASSVPVAVLSVAFRGSDRLLTTGDDGRIIEWTLPGANTAKELERKHDGRVTGLRFLAGGELLSCGEDGRLCAWDVTRAKLLDCVSFTSTHGAWTSRLLVEHLTAPASGSLAFETSQNKPEWLFHVNKKISFGWLSDSGKLGCQEWQASTLLSGLACSSTGREVYLLEGKSVTAWRLPEKTRLWSWPPDGNGDKRTITAFVSSPVDTRLAVVIDYREIWLGDARTGSFSQKAAPIGEVVTYLAFSPDGMWLAAGGDLGLVALIDVRHPERISRREGHDEPVSCLAFSSDGQTPDAKTLASASKGEVKLWDPLALHPRGTLVVPTGHSDVQELAFSPDGTTLAAGDLRGNVFVWQSDRRPPPPPQPRQAK